MAQVPRGGFMAGPHVAPSSRPGLAGARPCRRHGVGIFSHPSVPEKSRDWAATPLDVGRRSGSVRLAPRDAPASHPAARRATSSGACRAGPIVKARRKRQRLLPLICAAALVYLLLPHHLGAAPSPAPPPAQRPRIGLALSGGGARGI